MPSHKACATCAGYTSKGSRCKRCATLGSLYCFSHGAPPKSSPKPKPPPKPNSKSPKPPPKPNSKSPKPPPKPNSKSPKPPPKPNSKLPTPSFSPSIADEMLNACKAADFEKMMRLLRTNPELVNAQPGGRWSALHQAAYHANRGAVEYLLSLGADRQAVDKLGRTPLDVLSEAATPSLATLLSIESSNEWTVVTYNLSWAVAIHKATGSERQFVQDMCLHDGYCRGNAMKSLLMMSRRAHLYGFQEYRPWSDRWSEEMTNKKGPFVLPPVGRGHVMGPNNITLGSLFAPSARIVGYMSGIQFNFYSALFTCWDTHVFGQAVRVMCTNLVAHDARPCFVAYTSKRVLIVNAHAPQPHTLDLKAVFRTIDRACREAVGDGPKPLHIVITGDFNDARRALTSVPSVMGLAIPPPKMIQTCCYDPGYGMKGDSYQFPGDYVLSDRKTLSTHRIQGDGMLTESDATRPMVGRSDHDPIVALLSD